MMIFFQTISLPGDFKRDASQLKLIKLIKPLYLAHQVKSQCIIGFCLSLRWPHVRVDDTLLYYEVQPIAGPVVTKG